MTAFRLSRLLSEYPGPTTPVAESGAVTINFARFRADVAANALRLRQSGCTHGLLVTRDSYWAAVGLFALMQAGVEVVMPQNVQRGMLAAISESWDILVCDQSLDIAGPALVLSAGGHGADDALQALDPTTPLSFFTSGSTGAPKRVAKTLAHLEQEVRSVDAILGSIVPLGAWVRSTVTHQHVYGLIFRLCWPLATGRPFAGMASEYWETLLGTFDRGVALVTSPAHLTRLEGIPPVPVFRRPSLVLSAGAPLTEEAAELAAAVLSAPVTEIFGSTETGAIAWRKRDQAASMWQPLPGAEIKRTEDGRLCVRAANVPGGEHVSADLIDIATDGRFTFRGRIDSIVKIEGHRVSILGLEKQLRSLAWIADAAVVVLDAPVAQLAAAVVPTAAGAATLKEIGPYRFGRLLRRALAETQEPASLPRQWRFLDVLPTGTLGKRRLVDVVRLFARNNLPGALPIRPTEPEVRAVRSLTEGIELDLFISPDIACLEGHFPQVPIVPGVAQIDWAVKLAQRHLNCPIESAQTFRVKFRRPTVPNTIVVLALRHDGPWNRLNFEYSLGSEVLSRGSIFMDVSRLDG
jgi:acyl-coenzyme A synthetase/AMP-(fatty) acid ligase